MPNWRVAITDCVQSLNRVLGVAVPFPVAVLAAQILANAQTAVR